MSFCGHEVSKSRDYTSGMEFETQQSLYKVSQMPDSAGV